MLDLCSALTSVSSEDHKTEVFSCFLMIAECKISSRGDQKLLLLEGGGEGQHSENDEFAQALVAGLDNACSFIYWAHIPQKRDKQQKKKSHD